MQLRRLTRVDAFKTAALITKDEDDKPTFVTDDNHPYSALFSLRKTGSFRRNRLDYREKEKTADVFHGAINIYGLPMAVALDGCSELVAGEEIATLAVNIMNLLEELTHLLQGKELSKNDIRHIIREKYQQLDCLYQGKLSAEASFSAVAVYQDVNGLLKSIIFGIGGTLVSLDKGLNSEPVTLMLAKKTVAGSYLFEIEIKTVEENDRFILLMDDAKQSTKKAISFVDDITAGMMIVPTAKKQREMLCEICEMEIPDENSIDDADIQQAENMRKEVADLHGHLETTKRNILLSIMTPHENNHSSSINGLLSDLKEHLRDYNEQEKDENGHINNTKRIAAELAKWQAVSAIFEKLATCFPRIIADAELTQNLIIQYFVRVDSIEALCNKENIAKLFTDLRDNAKRNDTASQHAIIRAKAYIAAKAKGENKTASDIDTLIEVLRIEADEETHSTHCKMQEKLPYLQSFLAENKEDLAPKASGPGDKGKEKESEGEESSEPFHFDRAAMVSMDTPKIQLLYHNLIKFEQQENIYNQALYKLLMSEVKKRRKNEIVTHLENGMSVESTTKFLSHYHLTDKTDALKELQKKSGGSHNEPYLTKLKEQCDNICAMSEELRKVATNLRSNLQGYLRKRRPRAESNFFFLIRRDNVTLTKKKFNHANEIIGQLEEFVKKLDASLEFATEESLHLLMRKLEKMVEAEIQLNRANEHSHWKFHAWLPTSSKLETVLEDGCRAVNDLLHNDVRTDERMLFTQD